MDRGTSEPFLELHGKAYSREQVFAAYTKADTCEVVTDEEARLAAAWCVHPLISPIGLAPYGIAALLLRRQADLISAREELATLKADDWTPTAANINALPERIRRVVHQLETRCDPSGDTRELVIARDTCRALEAENSRLQPYVQQWQPIETAPKEYRWFIGYGPECGVAMFCWLDGKFLTVGVCEDSTMAVDEFWQPTHWMPLPLQPEEKQT